MLIVALSLAMLMIIWFKSDAFVEYVRLFHIGKLFKLEEYDMLSAIEYMTYQEFLTNHHNNFFTRLITCPVCTSTWLGGIGSIIYMAPLCSFGIAYLSLFLYLVIAKLLVNA